MSRSCSFLLILAILQGIRVDNQPFSLLEDLALPFPIQVLITRTFNPTQMSRSFNSAEQAFEVAKNTFQNKLKSRNLSKDAHKELLKVKTYEDALAAIEALERRQDSRGRIRRLTKVQSFISKLQSYTTAAVDFAGAKPEVLELIWGPIHLLLLWTENLTTVADAIVGGMSQIADVLPHFVGLTELFDDKEKLKHWLSLFFSDVLEFYGLCLEFFKSGRM